MQPNNMRLNTTPLLMAAVMLITSNCNAQVQACRRPKPHMKSLVVLGKLIPGAWQPQQQIELHAWLAHASAVPALHLGWLAPWPHAALPFPGSGPAPSVSDPSSPAGNHPRHPLLASCPALVNACMRELRLRRPHEGLSFSNRSQWQRHAAAVADKVKALASA